jgi:hypothetical protein
MNGVRRGESWGRPTDEPAARRVEGSDAVLVAAWLQRPDALIRFVPGRGGSDLAATLGLGRTAEASGIEVRVDVLAVEFDDQMRFALAHVVLGHAPHALRPWHRRRSMAVFADSGAGPSETTRSPGPAASTGVVVLNAQHLAGRRVAPRGHPGDGRSEVQWYGLAPGNRAAMRRRLGQGDHLDHPEIGQAVGRRIRLTSGEPRPLALDGERFATTDAVTIMVRPGALRLLL